MLVASKSATERPFQRIARTSGLNRFASQTGHGTKTSERNCISTRSYPSPRQWSQRPSPLLNENDEWLNPAAWAAGVPAKSSRISSHASVYKAGFERGVRESGD